GDPSLWSTQPSALFTFLSFLNTTKYPPSLLYILMTLGPSFLFLSLTEGLSGRLSGALVVIGRVPLFFYVVHIYLIHIIAFFAAILTGFPLASMTFNTWITDSPALKGYGFSLAVAYIVLAVVVLALYPLCKWFDAYKQGNKHKVWLSYL